MAQASERTRDLELDLDGLEQELDLDRPRSGLSSSPTPRRPSASLPASTVAWDRLDARRKKAWIQRNWDDSFSQDPEATGDSAELDLSPVRIRILLDALAEGRLPRGFSTRHIGLVERWAAEGGISLRPTPLRSARGAGYGIPRPFTRRERLVLGMLGGSATIVTGLALIVSIVPALGLAKVPIVSLNVTSVAGLVLVLIGAELSGLMLIEARRAAT